MTTQRRSSIHPVVALGLLSVLLLPVAALALPACSAACSPNGNCATQCTIDNGTIVTTCLGYGKCHGLILPSPKDPDGSFVASLAAAAPVAGTPGASDTCTAAEGSVALFSGLHFFP